MSHRLESINPSGLPPAKGFSHGMLAPANARLLFVAGQIACDATGRVVEGGFVDQFALALDNVLAVVTAAGGKPTDIARMTVYVTDRSAYLDNLRQLGVAWRERLGRHYPAMALVEVQALVEADAMVEIEATATIPETPEFPTLSPESPVP